MFEDFKKAVLDLYAEKKAKRQLSDNLDSPTRAKLKKECLHILEKRYQKKDDETIKDFFDPTGKFNNHEQRIQKFEADDFKALLNFLLGESTSIRKEENIKLLAWLIDFEPRPYSYTDVYNDPKKVGLVIAEPTPREESMTNEGKTAITDEPKSAIVNTKTPWKKIGIAAFFSILLGSISIFIYSNSNNNSEKVFGIKSLTTDTKQCMYWNIDHYQTIACDQIINGISVIPLEIQKLNSLKRITRPDTLGKKDLGKTWYVKVITDSIEFYTDSGSYPLDSRKRLKPLTPYILNKYPKGYNIFALNRFRNSK